jgi:hypothetical protein
VPSTSWPHQHKQDVDARDKRGHDGGASQSYGGTFQSFCSQN